MEGIEHVEQVGRVSVDCKVTRDGMESGSPVDGSEGGKGLIQEDIE